jgi:hypothetical protein
VKAPVRVEGNAETVVVRFGGMSGDGGGHSAEYFGAERDLWWNRDFLELLSRRFRLGTARSLLDVGSGLGHWGALLAPLLTHSMWSHARRS